ncbi:MAG: hypothetical protein JWM31_2643 [Solirubrobacterales bacterium]|nr:hypothetical protein [Solirubrobacterales bacterium]
MVCLMTRVHITEFTDPGCPWAFSAEPHKRRLDWLFGEQLTWSSVMVGLSEDVSQYEGTGFTPEVMAGAIRKMAADLGMPMDSAVKPRMSATWPACLAVIGARLHASSPGASRDLLRALRVRYFSGGLLDDPELIAAAARDAGLDPADVATWAAGEDAAAALAADMDRARHPLPAALALDHKLASWEGGRRYTCPSLEFSAEGRETVVGAGFQTLPAYEVLLANLVPTLERRATPEDVAEVLTWAGEPLSTMEVATVCELELPETRERLSRVAVERPVGTDGYWSLAA